MANTTTSDATSDALLYFAYGSNLSSTQMHERCPASTPIGLAHLAGWAWIINERGFANIVQNSNSGSNSGSNTQTTQDPQPTSSQENNNESNPTGAASVGHPGVYGLLYRLDPSDEPSLDACEGVPWAYKRRMVDVTIVEGRGSEGRRLQDGNCDVVVVQALAYVDEQRVLPALPRPEYVRRMSRGINEAMVVWALPQAYVDEVMRPFIPAL